MTLNELLLEWSYKSEKGYPSMDNPSDISLLVEILEQLENYATGDEAHITEPPQCMPDQYKTNDYVTAYRNYYVGDKKRFAKYKNCKTPKFMQ